MKWRMALALVLTLGWTAGALAANPPLPRPRPPRGLQLPAASSLPSPSALPKLPSVAAPGPTAPPDAAQTPLPPLTASEAASQLASPPEPVTLTASLTDGGAPLTAGVTWRIFDAKADESGQMAMVAKSDDAKAHLKLPPGDYVVHVAFGRAQASDDLTVGGKAVDKSLVVDAGGLRLNAAITGDVKIPPSLVHFDVYQADETDSETQQDLVARDVAPSEILTLNAGTYHIVSFFGDVNAEVKADLHVEPGKLTDATLYHKAAQVAFKLVSAPGGEAIADVDWTVKTSDGNTVFSESSAFPTTVLAEGDYLVFAKRGKTVYNRRFQVRAGPPENFEVLTTVTGQSAG